MFPRELFIELRLSKKQVEKLQRWRKDGHSEWFPMWFWNCSHVLFVNEDLYHEYILRLGKP